MHWTASCRNLAGLVAALACLTVATPLAAAVEIGEPPPDYLGKTADKEPVRISEHPGKVVIVNFWATWCKPCHEELKVLSFIKEEAGADRLEIFSINFKEDRRTYRKAVEALSILGLTFLPDSGRLVGAYGVKALPFLVIVGKDGLVRHTQTGYDESELPVLVEKINAALVEDHRPTEEAPASAD